MVCVQESVNRSRPIIKYLPFVEGMTACRLSRKIHTCREMAYEKSPYSEHSPHRL